jgi:hypothetical protein
MRPLPPAETARRFRPATRGGSAGSSAAD